MKRNESGQHDAIVTWAVEGSIRFHADPDTALRPSSRVEADTQAWRIEADRIMGYWRAWLVPDPGRCILSTELLQVFNAWLATNGHLSWSKETFGPRFKQHDETTKHSVRLAKISKLESLSRAPWAFAVSEVPRRPDAYLGVRFRSVTDAEETTEAEMAF
jgi:hypothetical protein